MVTVAGDSIIGIIGATLAIIVLIANAVYLNGVREELNTGTSTLNLSATGADVIFWIDVILAIIFGIYLIYNLWRIFTTSEQRSTVKQAVIQKTTTPVTAPVTLPIPTAQPQVAQPGLSGTHTTTHVENIPTRVTNVHSRPERVIEEHTQPESQILEPLSGGQGTTTQQVRQRIPTTRTVRQ